jgi:drug/metabolite transporter (DMT)-like permease
MGFFLGLSAGICFAAASILFKIGQRSRSDDDGMWMSVLLNSVILGVVSIFLVWPEWDALGVGSLVIGGVVGTFGGRTSNLKAIRLIGPSRSNAFLTGNPVFAALFGWFLLGETLGLQEFAGGALVILGLLWVVRARSAPVADPAEPPPTAGYLWALAAPVFFGTSFVFRKWGIEHFPGPVIGAFIGSLSALVVVSVVQARTGRLRAVAPTNVRSVSWWYVGAGLFTTLALLSQFVAFEFLPAWVVGILQGTQGLWTLLLGWLFLRREERIDRSLVGAILLVMVGVVLIGLEA